MISPLLQLDRISRHYQSGDTVVRALDDVSLTIHDGEFVAIMGQSGSGKSTLMNIIGCLDRPTSGHYLVKGRDVSNFEPDELATLRREVFGFVFQRYNLLANATAAENVEIPALYSGMKRRDRLDRAHTLLGNLGLAERADHRPSQLSGGQQQRVAIARALMNDPPVILADEPTGALDRAAAEGLTALLLELNREEGAALIAATHDPTLAARMHRQWQLIDGVLTPGATRA